jgi:hypothetical protein
MNRLTDFPLLVFAISLLWLYLSAWMGAALGRRRRIDAEGARSDFAGLHAGRVVEPDPPRGVGVHGHHRYLLQRVDRLRWRFRFLGRRWNGRSSERFTVHSGMCVTHA